MSWRDELVSLDNLKRAYFRGIPFYIKKSELSVGRRTKLFEYWEDKNTRVGDLGYKADIFNIEGYVIQTPENNFSYFENRNALIKAFKKLDIDAKGEVAILIHPYYGRRNVQIIEPAKFTETAEEGGICRFTVSLAEQGKAAITGGTPDPITETQTLLSQINAIISDSFVGQFNTSALLVTSTLNSAVSQMVAIQSSIYSVSNTLSSSIASAISTVSSAINTLAAVVSSPCDLYNTMQGGVNAMQSMLGMTGDIVGGGITGACSGIVYGEVTELNGEDLPQSLGTSVIDAYISAIDAVQYDAMASDGGAVSTGAAASVTGENAPAMSGMFNAQVAMSMVDIAVRIDFESRSDLIALREKITTKIDEIVLTSIDPVAIQQMEILRTEYARISLNQIFDLNNEVTYNLPNGVQSTLEIAYNQYNDVTRSDEIARRNNIKHAGFITERSISIIDE